jgi:hypothetical protein
MRGQRSRGNSLDLSISAALGAISAWAKVVEVEFETEIAAVCHG